MTTQSQNQVKIQPANPLDEQADLLNREEEYKNLTNLLTNINTPLVMAINSPWGSGKTFFIDKWSLYLDSQGIHNINFNAWKTDFSTDPLLTFISELDETFSKMGNEDSKSKWQEAKELAIPIAQKIAFGTVSALTANAVTLNREDFTQSTSELIQQYKEHKSAIVAFKIKLGEILSDQDKPLIIFVDELDRCRPNYAISLLESIKHFFDIEGVVFVLAVDREQLANSVNGLYGEKFDSKKYLDRFIDFDYILKEPDYLNYTRKLLKIGYLSTMLNKNQEQKAANLESIALIISFMAEKYYFKLRDIEQLISMLNIIFFFTKNIKYRYLSSLVFLLVIKKINSTLYQNFMDPIDNGREIIEYFRDEFYIKKITSYSIYNHPLSIIEGELISLKLNHYNETTTNELLDYHSETLNLVNAAYDRQKYSNTIISLMQEYSDIDRQEASITLQNLKNKIDMLGQFSFDTTE